MTNENGERHVPRTQQSHPSELTSRPQSADTSQLNASRQPRYGILGGTFDPPHLGHLVLAQEMWTQLRLDRVWFIPTGAPPHKKGHIISSPQDRRAMVALAIGNDERFALSTVEIDRPGPSYTVETLERLRSTWGAEPWIAFILGWDMLTYFPQWRDPAGVVARVDSLVATHRPGFEAEKGAIERIRAQIPGLRDKLTILPMPQIDLTATSLRKRVASGLPIRYLVPDTVCDYIAAHALYRDTAPKRAATRPKRETEHQARHQERTAP